MRYQISRPRRRPRLGAQQQTQISQITQMDADEGAEVFACRFSKEQLSAGAMCAASLTGSEMRLASADA
jgi:hypothetical protein